MSFFNQEELSKVFSFTFFQGGCSSTEIVEKMSLDFQFKDRVHINLKRTFKFML